MPRGAVLAPDGKFACPICPAKFQQYDNFTRHGVKHLPYKMVCKLCENSRIAGFRLDEMRTHMKLVHCVNKEDFKNYIAIVPKN